MAEAGQPTGPADGRVRLALASSGQERAWVADQLSQDAPACHVADRFTIRAAIGEPEIRSALERLVRRHASLRTGFRVVHGVLWQVIHPWTELPVESVDLADLTDDERARRCDALADELMYAEFDLGQPPLWRAALAALGDGGWVLIFAAHHAICDPASLFNLHAELAELCAAAEQRRDPVLPCLRLDYADYADQQRARLGGGPGRSGDFWRRQLAELPTVHGIPTDRPRPAKRTFAGAEVRAELPAEALSALPDLAWRHRAAPSVVLVAAYAALIHRWSGQDDIVIGMPVTGRHRPELLPLVGTFVNMIALRLDASGRPSFADLINRVRDVWLAALDHQETPFQEVADLVAGPRRSGIQPVYQLGFNVLTDRGFGPPSAAAEDDLLLEVAGGLVRLEYATALFDRATARDLLDDYVGILLAGLAKPLTPLPGPHLVSVT